MNKFKWVVKTCIILVLESDDNNEFPFEFLHPEENFDATLHENSNNLDKHLINDRTKLIDSLKKTDSMFSPSKYIHKPKVKRSFAERQTGERFKTIKKRCRFVRRTECDSQDNSAISRIDKLEQKHKTNFLKQYQHPDFYLKGKLNLHMTFNPL